MSESSSSITDLTSQYTAQVAGDLERNIKEQERASAEIAALQQQLAVLQHDHTVLVNMQQALAAPAPSAAAAKPAAPAESDESDESDESAGTPGADAAPGGAKVPAPRTRAGATSGTDKRKRGKKAAAGTSRAARKKPPRTSPAAASGAPKLVELVRHHLTEQNEPRSAAEIATALGRSHPERSIKTTVVRSTLEGLVARNQAQRTKQGSSVFYTSPDGTGPDEKSAAGARS